MIELIVPAFFFAFGIACLVRPLQIGVAFCRLGKATWKISTFGLTDMGRFYQEEKAAATFRKLGAGFILLSLPWAFIAYFSFSGPGSPPRYVRPRLTFESITARLLHRSFPPNRQRHQRETTLFDIVTAITREHCALAGKMIGTCSAKKAQLVASQRHEPSRVMLRTPGTTCHGHQR